MGGEYAVLHPSGHQLVVPDTHHMAADIMAPPSVADIAGRVGEVGLELEALPGNHCISGESHRVSVASHAGIAGEGHGTVSFPFAVQEMVMVQHPQRIQSRNLRDGSLLPVQPPEVHAFLLQRMMQILQVDFHEFGIRRVKLYRNLAGGVNAHLFSHPG